MYEKKWVDAFENQKPEIVRRVRLDLENPKGTSSEQALQNVSYEQWLENHAEKIMKLENASGEQLVMGMRSREILNTESTEGKTFVTDFAFASQEDYDYYNEHFLDAMRKDVSDSYPNVKAEDSPFSYSFGKTVGEEKEGGFDELAPDSETYKSLVTTGNYKTKGY